MPGDGAGLAAYSGRPSAWRLYGGTLLIVCLWQSNNFMYFAADAVDAKGVVSSHHMHGHRLCQSDHWWVGGSSGRERESSFSS